MSVSNDGANTTATRLGRGVVTVVLVTFNVGRVYPFQLLLPASSTALSFDSKAPSEPVRSVDAERLPRQVGAVPPESMNQLDEALRLHLAL